MCESQRLLDGLCSGPSVCCVKPTPSPPTTTAKPCHPKAGGLVGRSTDSQTQKCNCYGDVNDLTTTGNGARGVAGSRNDVDVRIKELNILKDCFDQIANEFCIEASLIGALASRESNVGASLTSEGLGDYWNGEYHGYGILQCYLYFSGLDCRKCEPFSCCHITMMVREKIVPDIKYMQTKFSSSSIAEQTQAAVAAYNTGRSRVNSAEHTSVDYKTTGHDYSNDVIARAQYLNNHYGWS